MNQDLNRRKDDRHPDQPLQWDDKPDLLAMRAGVNEIQREIERARSAGLTMLALPIETANAACCYVAHLGERLGESVGAAPAEQASKQVPTIDTPEFRELYRIERLSLTRPIDRPSPEFVAFIDAKLAGQPAAPTDCLSIHSAIRNTREAYSDVSIVGEALDHLDTILLADQLRAPLADQLAAQVACAACHGSGWVPRDAEIGTDQECFVCEGSGTVDDGQPAAPVAATEQATKITDTDSAREYLVKFSEQHFTDKTFHRYIRGERPGGGLAGDFAFQIAKAIESLATPADAGAGLTQQRISELWMGLSHLDRYDRVEPFARAIEREVLARLSTPPAPVTASEREAFEAWMRSEGWESYLERYNVYDPSDERGYKSRHTTDKWEGWAARAKIGGQSRAPVTAPQPAAQVPSIDRDSVLEEAAKACEAWGMAKVRAWADDEEMSDDAKARAWDASVCASTIRALKGKPAAAHAAHDQKGGGNA